MQYFFSVFINTKMAIYNTPCTQHRTWCNILFTVHFSRFQKIVNKKNAEIILCVCASVCVWFEVHTIFLLFFNWCLFETHMYESRAILMSIETYTSELTNGQIDSVFFSFIFCLINFHSESVYWIHTLNQFI